MKRVNRQNLRQCTDLALDTKLDVFNNNGVTAPLLNTKCLTIVALPNIIKLDVFSNSYHWPVLLSMLALLNTKYLTKAALPNINTIKPDVFNNGATAKQSCHY